MCAVEPAPYAKKDTTICKKTTTLGAKAVSVTSEVQLDRRVMTDMVAVVAGPMWRDPNATNLGQIIISLTCTT